MNTPPSSVNQRPWPRRRARASASRRWNGCGGWSRCPRGGIRIGTAGHRPAPRGPAPWAELLHRIFEVEPLECPRCGQTMRIVALITEPTVIDRILDHLRRTAAARCRSRAPPLVATAVGGVPDVLPESVGWWPPQENPAALADAMRAAMSACERSMMARHGCRGTRMSTTAPAPDAPANDQWISPPAEIPEMGCRGRRFESGCPDL